MLWYQLIWQIFLFTFCRWSSTQWPRSWEKRCKGRKWVCTRWVNEHVTLQVMPYFGSFLKNKPAWYCLNCTTDLRQLESRVIKYYCNIVLKSANIICWCCTALCWKSWKFYVLTQNHLLNNTFWTYLYSNTIFTRPWNLHNVTRPRLKSESLVFTLPPQFAFYENRIVVDSKAYFVNSKQLPGFQQNFMKWKLKAV